MIIQLLAGMFLGSIVTSLMWGIIVKSGKSKTEKPIREREAIMRSLGMLWVEVDSLVASFRRGKVTEKSFRETFASTLEKANRLLLPNMHLFDVYYIKYTENLIAHYTRIVRKSAGTPDITAGTASDIEKETSISFVERQEATPTRDTEPETVGVRADFSSEALENTVIETSIPKVVTPKTAPANVEPVVAPAPEASKILFTGEITTEARQPPSASEGGAAGSNTDTKDTEENVGTFVVSGTTIPGNVFVGEKTELFERPFDTEQEDGLNEELFETQDVANVAAALQLPVEKTPKDTVPFEDAEESGVDFDVVIEQNAEVSVDVPEKSMAPAALTDEEPVFESTASAAEELSAMISAQADKHPSEAFSEEDFAMETMMDIDINSLSSFLKPKDDAGSAAKPKVNLELITKEQAASDKEKKEELLNDLEIIIAANAGHTDLPVAEEAMSTELPEEPVFEKSTSKKAAVIDNDAIPDETTFTRADELVKKTGAALPESAKEQDDDFEVMFQAEPQIVTPPSPTEYNVTVEDEVVPVPEPELFEAELTDVDSDTITGDDVAEKIGALEFNTIAQSKKTASEIEVKKERAPQQPVAPGAEQKQATAPIAPLKKEPVKSTVASVGKKRADDAITGDDVADKIDAFFGLFNE